MRKIPILAFALAALVLFSAAAAAEPDSAILASNRNYPDAMVGGAAANRIGAPLLLTDTDQVPAETLAELESLGVTRIYIIGGPHVVSEAVEEQLSEDYEVIRLWGMTRYGTSAEVAEYFWEESSSVVMAQDNLGPPSGNGEIIAKARDLAQARNAPLILMPRDALPQDTSDALDNLSTEDVTLVGDTGSGLENGLENKWINISEKIQGNATRIKEQIRERVQDRLREKRPLVVVAVGSWSDLIKAPYMPNGTSRHISSEADLDSLVQEINQQNYSRIFIVGKPELAQAIYDRLTDEGIASTMLSGTPQKVAATLMNREKSAIQAAARLHNATRNMSMLQQKAQNLQSRAQDIVEALRETVRTLERVNARFNSSEILNEAARLRSMVENNVQSQNYRDALARYKMLENEHEQLKLRNNQSLQAQINAAITREKAQAAVKTSTQTGR